MKKYLISFLFLLLPFISFAASKNSLSITVGAVQTTGNTETTTFSLETSYTYKGEKWREYLNLSAIYGESKGDKTAERIEGSTRTERRIFPYFLFWDINFYRNPFQGYNYSVKTGPGIGRYIFKIDDLYLSASYYIYRVVNKLTNKYTYQPLEKRYERYFLYNIEERFKLKITDNTFLRQKLIYRVTSRSWQDYFLDGKVSVENKITKNLYLQISYKFTYQNRPVEKGIKRLDTIFLTSIKYSF